MAAPFKTWTVLPHAPLTTLDDNLLTVVGEIKLPVGAFPRRMTIVRLKDRRLVTFSAIALDEEEMACIENFGTPAFLIVPNAIHRQDARIWKDRYPNVQVGCPAGARDNVEKIVAVDTTAPDFGDANVRFVTIPGTLERESALYVEGATGATLVLNDIIGNIRNARGFGGWLLRMMKFAGDEPHIPRPVKAKIIDSKAALRTQFLAWAADPKLKRIVVSHGDIIDMDPRGVLTKLADTLS